MHDRSVRLFLYFDYLLYLIYLCSLIQFCIFSFVIVCYYYCCLSFIYRAFQRTLGAFVCRTFKRTLGAFAYREFKRAIEAFFLLHDRNARLSCVWLMFSVRLRIVRAGNINDSRSVNHSKSLMTSQLLKKLVYEM